MLESIINEFKDKKQLFNNSKFVLLEQNYYQHNDFLTVGWMLHLLKNNQQLTFIAFRQNYAHYLNLSKKLGQSIEPFLKNKKLTYIECFQGQYCSELPLTQTSPPCYISPPSSVKKILTKDLINEKNIFPKEGTVIIDAISFIDEDIQLCYEIYEQVITTNCRLIIGGCLDDSQIAKIFELSADLIICLENDVGNYGKFKVSTQNWSASLMWRNIQGNIQFTQHIQL